MRFPVFDFQAVPARGEPQWKPARYVAFVLPGGVPDDVQMIDLGEAEPIDRLIADFRAGIIAEAEAKRRPRHGETAGGSRLCPSRGGAGSDLRAALFDRLAPALGSRTRLLIAPDGDLARLPFEVLPTADGRRLIDDYQISYLSCGRDVLRFGAVATGQPGGPLVVADPDFDLETVTVREPAQPKAGFWSRLLGRGKKATSDADTIGPDTRNDRPLRAPFARPGPDRGDYHLGVTTDFARRLSPQVPEN